MPRQRSKKTSASRETAQKSVSDIDQENGQYESGNESVDMQEIGSDEEELDRLVFGNEAEFKAHLGHGIDIDEAGGSDGSDAEEAEDEEGEGLENVNDADVGSPLPLAKSPINFS
jgi:U3 small nucleolar RNA-associated protein 18